MWGMRKNPQNWTLKQTHTMHWLQRSSLKSARAWRLKMGLREVYARAAANKDFQLARADLQAWLRGPGAADSIRSRSWPRPSPSASTPSCAG